MWLEHLLSNTAYNLVCLICKIYLSKSFIVYLCNDMHVFLLFQRYGVELSELSSISTVIVVTYCMCMYVWCALVLVQNVLLKKRAKRAIVVNANYI